MTGYDYTENGRGRPLGKTTGLRPGERTGERNPNALMSDAEVRMMRKYREGGWTLEELAFLFPVSANRASEICRGLAYKDAGGPVSKLGQYNGRRGRPPKKGT